MSNIAIRRDKNALVLFSRKDGTKIRLAIGKYTKASRPELVDIKITDWCDVGCSFCYQGSTIFGKHATMDNVHLMVKRLSAAKVQESAFGGGEPLDVPYFVEICKLFREAGIVPNFTTKKPGMVRKLWKELDPIVGAFAYSAENAAQVKMAYRMFNGHVEPWRVNLHYIMGMGNREHFRDYLKAAHEVGYRVTLLGYKTTGRGKDVIPEPYDWWMDEVTALVAAGECPQLSIDTPLAEQYDGRMPIPTHMYHTREGAFSMYIDAVAMTMGASSFDSKEELQPFDADWQKRYRSL